MPSRRCVKCGSSWASSLAKCAFCGGESEMEAAPVDAQMPTFLRPDAAEPEVLLQPDTATAVAVEPTPSPADITPPPPQGDDEDAPRPIFEVTPMPPPCPRVPSPAPLLVFGLLGITASGILLPALLADSNVLMLVCGLFAPFCPIAWIAGLKYESRCAALNVPPAILGRAGRQLGLVGMALVTVQFAFGAIIRSLQQIAG